MTREEIIEKINNCNDEDLLKIAEAIKVIDKEKRDKKLRDIIQQTMIRNDFAMKELANK